MRSHHEKLVGKLATKENLKDTSSDFEKKYILKENI
jgi:hypothetical protein